jgi:phosphosulfolactate synthase (CoM biosynthesis protein A)/phosphosulfolactate phosphohydrolase-like enzyme
MTEANRFAEVTPQKPRLSRLTMVLDKGMGLKQLDDWLEVAAPFVDLVKFGWGTSEVIPRSVVKAKVQRLQEAKVRVLPGGTLTEFYIIKDRLREFILAMDALGINEVEVSDGTIDLPPQQRSNIVHLLKEEGFLVTTEVGSKDPAKDRRLTWEDRARLVNVDLEAGAEFVTIEARESGTLGFFGEDKAVHGEELVQFMSQVPINRVMFEAPLKSQQADLIHRIGSNVNLGNIPPDEVIPLETLRRGLRSDTLMFFHGNSVPVRLGQGPSDALAAAQRGDVVVVVDALRASSTIAAALTAGAREVRVVTSVWECQGEVTAGERGGVKVPEADLDNSPVAMMRHDFAGQALTLTSTNGAECIFAAGSVNQATVLIGALVNCTAVARAASRLARDGNRGVTVIMAGRNQVLAPEDYLSATEIVLAMGSTILHPGTELMEPSDPSPVFHESDSGRNLVDRGAESDVTFCSQKDCLNVVPALCDGVVKPLSLNP